MKKFKKTKPITTVEQFACLCYCKYDCAGKCDWRDEYDSLQNEFRWDTYFNNLGGQYQPYGITD